MVCKKFNQHTQLDRIFEHISIRRFERVNLLTSRRRHEEVYKFLEWCTESNNPEALYTKRMRWYFRYNNSELGIEFLKTTISKGRQASTYVYGAILVCQCGDEKERGLILLYSLNRQKLVSVMKCRERVHRFFWSIRVDMEVRGTSTVLSSKHATSVEVHKVLSQSDPIGIYGAMTNSVAAIRVDVIKK